MLEIERTFLPKTLPDLKGCQVKELFDIYLPADNPHPALRLRKNGDKFEMTKKTFTGTDRTQRHEETIILSQAEFEHLSQVKGKKVRKLRYFYPYKGKIMEIGIFQDELKGLALIDVEFDTIEEMEQFILPDFFLAEVKDDETFGGGFLAGKSYKDIEPVLKKYNYHQLHI